MGKKNIKFRATVIHEAVKALQARFGRWGVQSAVGSDLAWYVLLDLPSAIKQWKVVIYIQQRQGRILSLAQRLSAIDSRFSISSRTPTVMVYTHDVLHDGWSLKKRSCDITFIGTEWSRLSMVKDIACLPFKYLLFQRMKEYPNMPSTTKREHQMFQDVAASKAYLASTTSIWAGQITSQDEAMFDFLFEILCSAIPDAKQTFDTLHIFPSRRTTQQVTSIASLTFDARTSILVTSPANPIIPAPGSRAVVFRAVNEVTRIFREAQYTFAILGSTACYLYGNGRMPNDVDIIMSSHTCDLESMKTFLVTKNSNRFYLVDAKTLGATWKVLWYHDRGLKGKLEKTKVDILKPGVLHLPMIFSEAIVDKQGLPVIPMSILLPHKLQGWKDNMDSPLPRFRSKQDADAGDICSLLRMVVEGMSSQEKENSTYWKRFALERFDEEFRRETDRPVMMFCSRFPDYRDMWKTLGW
ncbi:hypothetical protein EDD18DRAFT_513719 [Armillaria luteobubalina]|uniref:Uncharacterized protein n=1 Tax=Armillaria luteobubalina TaxID=153913 RepID=A0AA39Q0A5_9AGAR|nr:hypothetical protein EDD18DRAFT_513719 [Armillaria luteobubalina]